MPENFRKFEAGPDPFGRIWKVEFKWLQTAISIRHADAVDCKFALSNGDEWEEKVIALAHTDLLRLSEKAGRPLTDPWCMKLAALHLKNTIETGGDLDKTIITPSFEQLEKSNEALAETTTA